jgi:hypothetical protein
MSEPERRPGYPNASVIYDAVRFVTVFGTLLLLATLGTWLVLRASSGGFYPGIRSFASVLFPIVVGSFLFLFNRGLIERLRAVPTVAGFAGAMLLGIAIMLALRFLAQLSAIPITELLVSACFSALVFTSGPLHALAFSDQENRALAYYYGVVSGMLLYVILFGFPLLTGSGGS